MMDQVSMEQDELIMATNRLLCQKLREVETERSVLATQCKTWRVKAETLQAKLAEREADLTAWKETARRIEVEADREAKEIASMRAVLREADEILTEMGWHTDRGLLSRIRKVRFSDPAP